MKQKTALAILWVLATTLIGGATWVAVSFAGDQISDDVRAPLSAADLSRLPVDETTNTAMASQPTSLSTPGTTTTSTPGTLSVTTTLPAGVTTTTNPSITTSTTSSTTTTSIGSTTTATLAGKSSVHSMVGGTVAIELSAETVRFLWATPAASFVYEVEDTGPRRVEVEFKSADHESRLRAEVIGGELVVEIDEEAEDS